MAKPTRLELAIVAWSLRQERAAASRPAPVTPPEVLPELLGAPSDRSDLRDTGEKLLQEAEFQRRHHREFHPGLSYVAPARLLSAPAAKHPLVDPLSAREAEAVQRLRRIGAPGGMSAEEAVKTLQRVRGTGVEIQAVELALSARSFGVLPEEVRIECAYLLVARGDRERALAVLEDAGDAAPIAAPELALDVDANVGEANAGEMAEAAERVLAQDLGAFGVEERLARWRALARSGKLTVEAFQQLGGRSKLPEARVVARALEDAGEVALAAEFYALAGLDAERARLGVRTRSEPPAGRSSPILAELAALDRRGKRVAAIAAARARLAAGEDIDVAAFARGVFARLARGPVVDLSIDGAVRRYALGAEVTIGRAGASIALESPSVSRRHLRLRRASGAAIVEDLGSHNGTWIAGARIQGAIAVGSGLSLEIAKGIPCLIRPIEGQSDGGCLSVEIAGERFWAPLGEARIGALAIWLAGTADEPVVALRVCDGGSARIGEAVIEGEIELCTGDTIHVLDGGAAATVVRVLPP